MVCTGYLEGNMVEGPDGTVYNVLRVNNKPAALGNYALALRYVPASNTLEFDRLFHFPGGHSKFTIRRDPLSGLYLSFTSNNTNILYAWGGKKKDESKGRLGCPPCPHCSLDCHSNRHDPLCLATLKQVHRST